MEENKKQKPKIQVEWELLKLLKEKGKFGETYSQIIMRLINEK